MGTLQQLAGSYERRAADGEALANRIIAGLNILSKELEVTQRESAEALLQDAQLLQQEAAGLLQDAQLLRHEAAGLRENLLKLQPHLREKDFLSHIPKAASQLVLRRLNILRPLQ